MPGSRQHKVLSIFASLADAKFAQWSAMLIGLIGLAIILWWEPGLKMAPSIEAWSYYNEFSRGSIIFPGLIAQNRPSASLPYYLGYVLTPNSFIGLNIWFIIIYLGRGLVLYAILRNLLPSMPDFAAAAALLTVVYPFDPGSIYIRYMHYQTHSLLILIAIYLLVLFYQRPQWGLAAAIAVVQVLALSMYEVAYTAFLIAPLLLVMLNGRFDRRILRMILGWYIVPLIMGLNFIRFLSSHDATYQGSLLSASSAVTLSLRDVARLMFRPFQVGLVQEWKQALSISLSQRSAWLPAMLAGVVSGVIVLFHGQEEKAQGSHRKLLLAAGFGLVFMGATFLPYVSVPHRFGNFRVFTISVPGAALVFLGIFRYLLQRIVHLETVRRILFMGGGVIFIGIGTAWSLHQQNTIYTISQDQQVILAETASLVPEADDRAVLVLFGDEQRLTFDTHLFAFDHFGHGMDAGHFIDAMRWIYDDADMAVNLCFLTYGDCRAEETGLQNSELTIPYERVIGLYFDGERMHVLDELPTELAAGQYDPWSLIHNDAPIPYRVQTALPAAANSHDRSDGD